MLGNYCSNSGIDLQAAKIISNMSRDDVDVLCENGIVAVEIWKHYKIIKAFAEGKPVEYSLLGNVFSAIDELPIYDVCVEYFKVIE